MTDKTEWTEGPWSIGSTKYVDGKPYGINVAGRDGYHVCAVSSRSAMNGQKAIEGENLSNAVLISCAPEMYAALKKAVAQLKELGSDGLDSGAQAVIEKAEWRAWK